MRNRKILEDFTLACDSLLSLKIANITSYKTSTLEHNKYNNILEKFKPKYD